MNTRETRWIVRRRDRDAASMRLFCLPYSGAGAVIFREWFDLLPKHIDVCAIEPPGRMARRKEPAPTSIEAFVAELDTALGDWLDLPFAVFGYSLGAIVAFEWCHVLRARGAVAPVQLIVAASGAPQLPRANAPISHLPDAEFRQRVERYYGALDPVLAADRDMLRVILDILRHDLRTLESYTYVSRDPLQLPILAVGGSDDSGVRRDRLEGWRAVTEADFRAEMFPGGHFFLRTQARPLTELITRTLTGRTRDGLSHTDFPNREPQETVSGEAKSTSTTRARP